AGEGLVNRSPAGAAISGTSYAAAVVSGVAALVRARSPELTARQVMRRVEDTAHHPAGAWDAVVGRGVIDALAAVSDPGPTDPRQAAAPPNGTAGVEPVVEQGAERWATQSAVLCFILTAGIVMLSATMRRLRRGDETVSGD
ncbi:MAG: S8 family serine peptidase, partial [Mycobacterium sp.]